MIDFLEMTNEQIEILDPSTLDSDVNKNGLRKEKFKRKVNRFIEKIINEYYPKTIMGDKDQLYLYIDGYYNEFGKSMLKNLIDKEFGNENTSHLYGTVLHKIESHTMIEREKFIEEPNRINLENGVLDVYSNTIEPHNPKYNFLYRLERNYDPDNLKDCPLIKKFLMDICENNLDKYWLIIEFFGFILISDYKIKKLLCIFGDGDNGKTTLANLMTEFINKKNTSGLSMNQIETSQFLQSSLYGKKLNIKGESIPTKLSSLEMLKSLTGQDDQEVNRKFKDSLRFVNTAKFVFHFNKLPLMDLTKIDEQGLNRILLLELNNKFINNKDDKNLIGKLTDKDEMEGLLHLAIQGLKRLRKNHKFTYDDSTTHDILLSNQFNPLEDFIKTKCEINFAYETERHKLLNLYNNVNGNKPTSLHVFTSNLMKYGGIQIAKRGKSKEQQICYIGIKIKEETTCQKSPI